MFELSNMLKRIKDEKKKQKLTNSKLSDITKIPLGTLNKILSGDSKDPQVSAIIKIAQALNVSADYLIFGKEPQQEAENLTDDIGIQMYKSLDEIDKSEIRGEMKHMLKSEKYSQEKTISNDIIEELKQDVVKTTTNIK